MKKILILVMMVLLLASCGDKEEENEELIKPIVEVDGNTDNEKTENTEEVNEQS